MGRPQPAADQRIRSARSAAIAGGSLPAAQSLVVSDINHRIVHTHTTAENTYVKVVDSAPGTKLIFSEPVSKLNHNGSLLFEARHND